MSCARAARSPTATSVSEPQAVTEAVKEAMGLDNTEGVLVGDVQWTRRPAKQAGIQPGDVITTFDGTKITDVDQFRALVAGLTPGKTVVIDLVRDGKRMEVKATLQTFPENPTAAAPTAPKTWLGIAATDLSAQQKEQLGVTSGVVVASVDDGSAAQNAGIQANDVITKIVVRARNVSEPIQNLSDFARVTALLQGYQKPIAVSLTRDKMTQIVVITPGK